jgi:hypothetical protein
MYVWFWILSLVNRYSNWYGNHILLTMQYTRYSQKNGAVLKVNNKFISYIIQVKHTPLAEATVQVSHALLAVRFSWSLRGNRASFQDGVAERKGFLCALFWGVQVCDYSAAWVLFTV